MLADLGTELTQQTLSLVAFLFMIWGASRFSDLRRISAAVLQVEVGVAGYLLARQELVQRHALWITGRGASGPSLIAHLLLTCLSNRPRKLPSDGISWKTEQPTQSNKSTHQTTTNNRNSCNSHDGN